ncbi:MAG TPA: methyltransferase domain-containing protein [Ktedonobacteraceae bacterium]|nr:methyltransferase domain-containing protein [Ktedonobacteraceae bacterium]
MPMNLQKQGYSGTYFVEDQQGKEELLRLANQDRLVTASMGGVLAEQADPGTFRRVLDVACGPGGWVIEAAQTYPEMSLVGIDINQRMIRYARAQAAAHHIDNRVEFHVMDALNSLEFPNASFDLVNLRFGVSFVRTWDWPRLLSELMRVVRPGGVVRLTDEEIIHQSTSPAAMQFCEMLLCALFRSGHLFAQESTGLTAHLALLLSRHGCLQVQAKAYTLQYQAGTPEGQAYVEDGMHVLRTLRPFLQKWGCMSKDYNAIHRQVLEEIQRPDFCATWHLLMAWGIKPSSHPV